MQPQPLEYARPEPKLRCGYLSVASLLASILACPHVNGEVVLTLVRKLLPSDTGVIAFAALWLPAVTSLTMGGISLAQINRSGMTSPFWWCACVAIVLSTLWILLLGILLMGLTSGYLY